MSQCVSFRLGNLKRIHNRNKALISNKDIVNCLMVCMYSFEYTIQALFTNGPYNETAAAQGPWHRDRAVSSKDDAVEESGTGKYAQSIIAACTCTHTCNIRIKMASARFYYTGCMSMM